MKMAFLKLFLFCLFKEPNLAEKGQIWKKMFLKVELHRVHRVLFFSKPVYNLCIAYAVQNMQLY